MKKTLSKIILLALSLIMIMSVLSSCVITPGEDYISREELDDILGSIIAGDVTIENAPTYNIEIEGDANRNVAAAAKAVLSAVSVYATFELGYTSGINSTGTAAGAGVIYKIDKNFLCLSPKNNKCS